MTLLWYSGISSYLSLFFTEVMLSEGQVWSFPFCLLHLEEVCDYNTLQKTITCAIAPNWKWSTCARCLIAVVCIFGCISSCYSGFFPDLVALFQIVRIEDSIQEIVYLFCWARRNKATSLAIIDHNCTNERIFLVWRMMACCVSNLVFAP